MPSVAGQPFGGAARYLNWPVACDDDAATSAQDATETCRAERRVRSVHLQDREEAIAMWMSPTALLHSQGVEHKWTADVAFNNQCVPVAGTA